MMKKTTKMKMTDQLEGPPGKQSAPADLGYGCACNVAWGLEGAATYRSTFVAAL